MPENNNSNNIFQDAKRYIRSIRTNSLYLVYARFVLATHIARVELFSFCFDQKMFGSTHDGPSRVLLRILAIVLEICCSATASDLLGNFVCQRSQHRVQAYYVHSTAHTHTMHTPVCPNTSFVFDEVAWRKQHRFVQCISFSVDMKYLTICSEKRMWCDDDDDDAVKRERGCARVCAKEKMQKVQITLTVNDALFSMAPLSFNKQFT